jgi:hypothetical protein
MDTKDLKKKKLFHHSLNNQPKLLFQINTV